MSHGSPGALARLQQAGTLAAAAASLGTALMAAAHQRPALAVLALLAVPLLHAAVLGSEFLLQMVFNRRDPLPAPGAAMRLSAWAGEVRDAMWVFGWWQPWRSQAEADHLPPGARGAPGVLLVHGFVCNRGVWTPAMRRLRRDGVPFIAVNLEPVFGSIDDYPPILEAAARRLAAHTGHPPVVVAHSMGGLAVRAWLRAAGGPAAARVHHLVTVGTPHQGTALAQVALPLNTRQMRRGSPWLRALAAEEPADLPARTTCVLSSADNIVMPASSALLPGARAVFVPGVAHVGLAQVPQTWACVAACRAATVGGDNAAHAGMA